MSFITKDILAYGTFMMIHYSALVYQEKDDTQISNFVKSVFFIVIFYLYFLDIKYFKISGEEYPKIFTREETFDGTFDTATKVRIFENVQ